MSLKKFNLISKYTPAGDQPKAIKSLVQGIKDNCRDQILLGVTGSGKTFTIANVIQKVNMPVLVISPNKTLAAQLYSEFKAFFPNNPVEYFISYYDYYQPEAYIPHTDTYIEKDSSVNEKIDRLRLKATTSLLDSKNCIIVASVSCIYGLGSPEDYEDMIVSVKIGDVLSRKEILSKLVSIQYERNEIAFIQGKFRVKGDIVDIFPAYLDTAVRIEFFEDEVDRIVDFNPVSGEILGKRESATIYPAKHFVIKRSKLETAIVLIKKELKERLKELEGKNKLLEAQRLEQKTEYDIEMLNEMGYCSGIENYSRHLSGRKEGQRPFCLIDYFPKPFLTIIDESHVSVPQIRAMYNGDRARKKTLVKYGFRLPSALDNRPMKFMEFEKTVDPVVYISATPGDYELTRADKKIVEQIIRPTGLVDPYISVRPHENMIKDIFKEVRKVIARGERVLITTLTKRLAEDLAEYFDENDFRARYMHSEIHALERVKIITEFRQGKFDCLIGINLLREGLDLPEVSLVVITDADKEGFLRSERSLIQVSGRASRNVNGQIIMYADKITGSMRRAIDEMDRRRKLQIEYNKKYNIKPETIKKDIDKELAEYGKEKEESLKVKEKNIEYFGGDKKALIEMLKEEMKIAAEDWDFERAAELRDRIKKLEKR
ncbi:excinuclease ABC subunit UvrB [bacterium]